MSGGAGAELIVAVDYQSAPQALDLAETLSGLPVWLKVGLELFTAEGPPLLKRLGAMGFALFLDLKFHDIPNTVQGAVRSASALGVRMLTVHTAGGAAPAVMRERVLERALMARECGLDGIVCSGLEAETVKAACGRDFLCLCPGIRFAGTEGRDDQARVCTPVQAALAGADFIVMGRPITRAGDPAKAAKAALEEARRSI